MAKLSCPMAQLERDMEFYTFGDYDFEWGYSLTEKYYKQLCIDFSGRKIPGINEFQCSNQDKIGSLPEIRTGTKKRILCLWELDTDYGKVIPVESASSLLRGFGDHISPNILFVLTKLAQRLGVFNPDLNAVGRHSWISQINPVMQAYLEILLGIAAITFKLSKIEKGSLYEFN